MSCSATESKISSFRAPAALRPGSCIAVVAPSSPFDAQAFDAGVQRLAARYEVRSSEDLRRRSGYLAGDDTRRAEELEQALRSPEVEAIVAARGGYGATRLLQLLPVSLIHDHPKLLIGLSDLTALHALWQRAGLRSLHACMVTALGRCSQPAFERWTAAVEGGVAATAHGLVCLRPGVAQGPLVGGNLAVLAALCGTPFEPPLQDAILFVEDIGERPYRVDRMLTTLDQAGWFRRARGAVVGSFTDCHAGNDCVEVQHVLEERLKRLPIPVLMGLAAGHVDDGLELPLGAQVRMDAERGELHFLEPACVAAR